MNSAKSMLLLTALGTVVTAASEQTNTSFAGTWVATDVASVQHYQLVIVQDGALMKVTDGRGRALTYRLDGSESRSETTTVVGEKWGHVSRAKWVSVALVVTTTTTRESGKHWDWITIYRRDVDGGLQVTTLDAVTDPGPFGATSLKTVAYKSKS